MTRFTGTAEEFKVLARAGYTLYCPEYEFYIYYHKRSYRFLSHSNRPVISNIGIPPVRDTYHPFSQLCRGAWDIFDDSYEIYLLPPAFLYRRHL